MTESTESMDQAKDTRVTTRRGFLGVGATLALAAPMVAALGGGATVSAQRNQACVEMDGLGMALLRVSAVSGFGAAAPTTNPRIFGSLRVEVPAATTQTQMSVRLFGARRNTEYRVVFVAFNGTRIDLGAIRSDAAGRFDGSLNPAGGVDLTRTVGTFLLTRLVQGAQRDIFVASTLLVLSVANMMMPEDDNGNGNDNDDESNDNED